MSPCRCTAIGFGLALNFLLPFVVDAVPALGLEYYKCPAAQNCSSLKTACFSGEAMPLELVELIYRNVPKGVTVVNAYGELGNKDGMLLMRSRSCSQVACWQLLGILIASLSKGAEPFNALCCFAGPTEATVMATNLKCWAGMKHMSIGYPEANMHCYIVDRFMQPVPVGVPGELLLSGPRLARGYMGRPDLTADKFIPNPCYDDVSSLLPEQLRSYFKLAYRTGRQGSWY
jgi:acyl-coenzyme A synthetase/AMP-(fatty) acid ligase